MKRVWRKRGFILVELLVVITIIGILIALLLPAVQAAREAARRLQCTNNLKQLALGCLGHESATKRFPCGGWGFGWAGDADRGNDWRQPGGWIYNILPFIEQQPLHDSGMGLDSTTTPTKSAALLQEMLNPLNVLYCPTRRPPLVYPWKADGWGMANTDKPTVAAREDYASNGGDVYTSPGSPVGPVWASSYENIEGGPASLSDAVDSSGQLNGASRATFSNVAKYATGIMYCGSMIGVADVTDGVSNTCLLGEKYVCPDHYDTGGDPSDNESCVIGENADISRWSGRSPNFIPPSQDTPGYSAYPDWSGFGSAHANSFNMAFCDGSVHSLSYTIDLALFSYLCNRKDDQPIDAQKLNL